MSDATPRRKLTPVVKASRITSAPEQMPFAEDEPPQRARTRSGVPPTVPDPTRKWVDAASTWPRKVDGARCGAPHTAHRAQRRRQNRTDEGTDKGEREATLDDHGLE